MPAGAVLPQPIRVTGELLADLGGGPSRPGTISFLRSTQLAKHLQLLLALVRSVTGPRRAAAEEALAVLVAAQEARPAAVGELLSRPFTGAWLSSAWRRRATDQSHLDHLAVTAVAAGVRAGLSGELTVVTPRGVLDLSGVGRVEVGPAETVRAGFAEGQLLIEGEPAGPRLATTRVLRWGDDRLGCAVEFEDLDPYRDCYHVPAAPRRPDDDVARWDEVLAEAWELIVAKAPDYAAELSAGLRAVVPLVAEPGSPGVSATSRMAFGAVALSLPQRADHAAATLIHEFQHSKLSALLDLVALYDRDSPDRYFAPWRRDPRPVGGLLQGAYAFFAVADLWTRLGTDLGSLDASERDFADLREQLGEVLATLRGAAALNEDGRRLVARISERFDTIVADAVAADRISAARERLERKRQLWEQFNA